MSHERILIADDEPHILRLCSQALKELGYRVGVAPSGQEALDRLRAEPFDVLIVDIQMPDLDGLTVLRRARDLDPSLTGVVVTGYATMNRTIKALQAGARGFVMKPFGLDELSAAIELALAQRQREQERLRLGAQLPILEISQARLTSGEVESLAQRLLEVVVEQTEAQQGKLLLLNEEAKRLHVIGTCGPDSAEKRPQLRHLPVAGLAAQGLALEAPLVLGPPPDKDLKPVWREMMSPRTGLVLVPLRTTKQTIGLLALGHPIRDETISESQLALCSIVAGQIAVALENARMYALEQQRTAELARALEQQRELDGLKEQFIHNVSHELRTPLSLILSYAELLASGDLGELQPEQQEPIHIIEERALALRDLVDDITALLHCRDRKHAWEPVALILVVQDALKAFQVPADQAGLTLTGDLSPETPQVWGDPKHLRQAVDNLIGNAIKFTPSGGSVTVSLYEANGSVVIKVADTGIGIAAGQQSRIFDRFYQINGSLHRRYEGSGLGLAVVQEIAESHEGAIDVESCPGQGSTFRLSLPAMASTKEQIDA